MAVRREIEGHWKNSRVGRISHTMLRRARGETRRSSDRAADQILSRQPDNRQVASLKPQNGEGARRQNLLQPSIARQRGD